MNSFRRISFALSVMVLAVPANAQFSYATNNGTITITEYTNHDAVVVIPSTVNGLSVTAIGDGAFINTSNLSTITLPDSITTIGAHAFFSRFQLTEIIFPTNLTSIGEGAFEFTGLGYVALPNGLTSIPGDAFRSCLNLTSVGIPHGVTNIASGAFAQCQSLSSMTIPSSVASIEDYAFRDCYELTQVLFEGNAPLNSGLIFTFCPATAYYLPGTTGWGSSFGGWPTVLWDAHIGTDRSTFGVRTNRFGFTITGNNNLIVVVEACTNLSNPTWFSVRTNSLKPGPSYFSDAQWTNSSSRIYRLRPY